MTNPNPVAFSIFGFNIMWYGIVITVGAILAIILAMKAAKKYGWNEDDIIDVAILILPLGVVGARLYYVIFNDLRAYLANPISIIRIRDGGLAIYGGIIAGALAALLYSKWKKRDLRELLDIAIPGVALAQSIGRWGNFFNQEAYGPLVTNLKHAWFPFAVRIDATQTIHYATFFYESVWCLLIFIFLFTQRKKFKHKGDVALWYALLYSFERMFVESLRTDSLYIGSLRVSQALSVVLFVCVGSYMVLRWNRERKNPVPVTNKVNPDYVALDGDAVGLDTLQMEDAEKGSEEAENEGEEDCDTCIADQTETAELADTAKKEAVAGTPDGAQEKSETQADGSETAEEAAEAEEKETAVAAEAAAEEEEEQTGRE